MAVMKTAVDRGRCLNVRLIAYKVEQQTWRFITEIVNM